MVTKQEIIRMSRTFTHDNVYNLDYYRARVQFLDDYKPTKPAVQVKFKTDRERVKEIQQQKGNYKDLRK